MIVYCPVDSQSTVTINKCCRIGEHLENAGNGTADDITSIDSLQCIIGGTEKWYPKVFLIRNRKYASELPKFVRVQDSLFPKACNHPEFISGKLILFSNGSLFLTELSKLVHPEHYCVERDSAVVCFPDSDVKYYNVLTKIRKCCPPRNVYDNTSSKCTKMTDQRFESKQLINSSNIEMIYGFPECNMNDYAIAGRFNSTNFEDATGVLTLDSGKHLQRTQYCLEQVLDGLVNVFTCSDHFQTPELAKIEKNDIRFAVYAIGLLVSVIFLTATLAAGFLVPSNHHVLHWRCQTHYVGCLLVGDFLLAINQLAGNAISGITCVGIAIMMHFFFLAAFFWLNTMCFNIWWTFRDFRPTTLEKGQEICRLRIYIVYAWGLPLLISGLAVIYDNIPEDEHETFLRPRFGERNCWFYGDMEILTYFFGPIGILLCINLLLFASTARQLTCGLWKRDDVKSTTERAALGRVCLKLVVVMGVTWMADVISWAVGGPSYIWIFTDLINALQGVLIFIVVGCQPQVWSAIKRLWTSKTGRGTNTTTNGPQHSSSSHGLPSMGESVTNNTFANSSTKIPMETIC